MHLWVLDSTSTTNINTYNTSIFGKSTTNLNIFNTSIREITSALDKSNFKTRTSDINNLTISIPGTSSSDTITPGINTSNTNYLNTSISISISNIIIFGISTPNINTPNIIISDISTFDTLNIS